MADVTVHILEPATEFALMTVDEMKKALGVIATTPATDDQWDWLIDVNSATISDLCNRVFAKEKVTELWRDLVNRRVYLTHFPVKADDIESVTTAGNARLDYELEEMTGKLSIFTDQSEPISVTYTGGYDLPDEAPLPLKQACVLMSATWKAQLAMVQVTGVRMIAHKEARVMFHSPTIGGNTPTSSGSMSGVPPAVVSILTGFTKFWV